MPVGLAGPAALQPSQPHRRASQTRDPEGMPSREDLAKIQQDVMSLAKQARELLEKQGNTLVDAQGNKALLAHSLLLLAHCMLPSILPKDKQAVATFL